MSHAAGRPIDRDTYFRFYAAEISYFSGKIRPALRAKRLPFVEILPTPEVYREVILPRTGLGFIPIVITPEDEAIQDTSVILDALEARFPDPPLYPTSPVQRVVSYLWELFCDEFMILPALHYRWSFPESETKARADFAAMNGNPEQAQRFADRIKTATTVTGIVPATIAAIEAHTRDLLDAFEAHLAEQPFLLGARLSLADLSLLGPLYPHLYLDAVPGRLLRATWPRVCHWIERANHPVPSTTDAWLPGDALARTMRPMLELIGRDAIPLLLDTVRAVEEWAAERGPSDDDLPRAVGMHRTALRGVPMDRYTSPYTLWMVQRPLDAYRALGAGDRGRVDAALAGTGCEALLACAPRHRVVKRGFKLGLERA
jgi:glutathione S-transferase